MYTLGSPLENQIPTHWNMTDFSMTAQPLVLSPSSILLPHSSHCAFTPASKNFRACLIRNRKITSSFYYTPLKLRKSETADLKCSSVD
jgi:hypothetical protein